jgi:hypothetical protein
MNNPTPTPAPLRATPRTNKRWNLDGDDNAEAAWKWAEQLEQELQDATAAATGAKELADELDLIALSIEAHETEKTPKWIKSLRWRARNALALARYHRLSVGSNGAGEEQKS